MRKRRGMQNQPNEAGPLGLAAFDSPVAALAHPKIVLVAAGLFGLALDLFVRRLSWIGLALIVLATAPWILEAWTQRSARAVKAAPEPRPARAATPTDPVREPRPEQRIVPGAQRAAVARPEQPALVAREAPRAVAPAAPPARQQQAQTRLPEDELRPAAPRPGQARSNPPKLA